MKYTEARFERSSTQAGSSSATGDGKSRQTAVGPGGSFVRRWSLLLVTQVPRTSSRSRFRSTSSRWLPPWQDAAAQSETNYTTRSADRRKNIPQSEGAAAADDPNRKPPSGRRLTAPERELPR